MKSESEFRISSLVLLTLGILPGVCSAQDEPSQQEILLVSAAIRHLVTNSVTPAFAQEVNDRCEAVLASKSTVWKKTTATSVSVRHSFLNAEYSLQLGELTWFEFVPRDNHLRPLPGSDPIVESTAMGSANRLLGSQFEEPWALGPVQIEEMGPVVCSLWARPFIKGLPYATHRIRLWMDRFTGCAIFLDRSFTFLPLVAHSTLVSIDSEVEARLQAAAIDAYGRWRPLDSASIVWQEPSYNIPNWARHDNEMTPLHHQLAAEKKITPVYRVSLLGTRGTRPYSVSIFVDVQTERPIAISETPLDVNEALGGPRIQVPGVQSSSLFLLDGRAIHGEWKFDSVLPPADLTILLKTGTGAFVLCRVDKSGKSIWRNDPRSESWMSLICDDRTWSLILRTIERPDQTFGLAREQRAKGLERTQHAFKLDVGRAQVFD